MPAPKMPTASPRRCGGNHALTNGTPTANAVPATPRKNPPVSSAASEVCPATPMNRTGTMVTADTSGNITRPPYRSVSAPTGIRPSEPTITGTATSSACCGADRPSSSLKRGPRGLSSAQAQKFTAKPTVARASISMARPSVRPVAILPLSAVEPRLIPIIPLHPVSQAPSRRRHAVVVRPVRASARAASAIGPSG